LVAAIGHLRPCCFPDSAFFLFFYFLALSFLLCFPLYFALPILVLFSHSIVQIFDFEFSVFVALLAPPF